MLENKFEFNSEEVQKIKLEATVLPMKVKEVAEDAAITITVIADEEKFPYTCELKEGKVKLKFKENTIVNPKKLHKEIEEAGAGIFVEIPANKSFKKFTVFAAATKAELNLPTVQTEKTKLEIGAGQLNLAGLATTGLTKIEIGAGQLKMASPGAGDFKIECGLGKVEINLDKPENYYNYSVDCGLGKVKLNGQKLAKAIAHYSSDAGGAAEHIFDVECGLGKVSITTLAI